MIVLFLYISNAHGGTRYGACGLSLLRVNRMCARQHRRGSLQPSRGVSLMMVRQPPESSFLELTKTEVVGGGGLLIACHWPMEPAPNVRLFPLCFCVRQMSDAGFCRGFIFQLGLCIVHAKRRSRSIAVQPCRFKVVLAAVRFWRPRGRLVVLRRVIRMVKLTRAQRKIAVYRSS